MFFEVLGVIQDDHQEVIEIVSEPAREAHLGLEAFVKEHLLLSERVVGRASGHGNTFRFLRGALEGVAGSVWACWMIRLGGDRRLQSYRG